MLNRATLILTLGMLGACASTRSEDITPTITQADLSGLISYEWTGTLTYLNYGEPKQDFTIPAELDVELTEGGLKLFFQYPEEPDQNSEVTVLIGEAGRALNGDTVTGKTTLLDGSTEVRTSGACEDMGRAAMCEVIYTWSISDFEMKKMVTYAGETEAFRRNAYVFSR